LLIYPLDAENSKRGTLTHSKKASIGQMSYSSQQSRFTIVRPKNPTDVSVSSKGSLESSSMMSAGIG